MTFWERLVVGCNGCRFGRWLEVWYTGHHFENCWLMLKRPPLEPKHFIVWWVFSFSSLLDRFQRFSFFWCRFLVWRGRMTTLLDCFAGDISSVVLQDAPENFNSQDFLRWRFDLSMILTPQALLKWTIYWMVCCVSTGWSKKLAYMLFNHHSRFAKFATSWKVDDYQSKLVIGEHPARFSSNFRTSRGNCETLRRSYVRTSLIWHQYWSHAKWNVPHKNPYQHGLKTVRPELCMM